MKFGKYIQSQQAEWAGPQYLNYKGLKKIINSLKKSPPDQQLYGGSEVISAEEKQVRELQALKTAFFFKLERELEKVRTGAVTGTCT
ncbi:phosphate system positive regulatory protein pho81 [Thoreauomyces humboldtii]|nr:phosphate system positive regulatory protein pho81 [Thoreauomyces humboldtii]